MKLLRSHLVSTKRSFLRPALARACARLYQCDTGRTIYLGARLVALRLEHADERQVAVDLGEVESVADDEAARDLEADVVERHVGLARLVLVEQGADAQAGGFAGQQHLPDVTQR